MNKVLGLIKYYIIILLLIAAPLYAQQPPSNWVESCDPVLQKGLERCVTSLNLDKAADIHSS